MTWSSHLVCDSRATTHAVSRRVENATAAVARHLLKAMPVTALWALMTSPALTATKSPSDHAVEAVASDAECSSIQDTFDGTKPLRFAVVTGTTEEHIALSRAFPQRCTEKHEKGCLGGSYVVPGDQVAIGTTCGHFVHVQFIGKSSETIGWVASDRLRLGPLLTPQTLDGGYYPGRIPHGPPYLFHLMRGKELPVCKAYLQRLNLTHYESPPYCDRPEDDSVPGFGRLKRMQLQPAQINLLYPVVYDFSFPPLPSEPAWVLNARRDMHPQTIDEIDDAKNGRLGAWKYSPPVDIDNDGRPDNVMMWFGVGINGPGVFGSCGRDVKETGGGERHPQMPLVFKNGDQEIDIEATKRLIAHPVQQYSQSNDTGNLYATAFGFRPVARQMGVFEYQGTYYLDGFFDVWGDALDQRQGKPQLANTLAVFEMQGATRRQLCEYQLSDNDYPRP